MCSENGLAGPHPNGVPFKNAQGEPDVLPLGELQCVERSGRSTWMDYATTPGEWPFVVVPMVPLMEARPGAVEPLHVDSPTDLSRNGMDWSYDECCALVKTNPSRNVDIMAFAKQHGRTPMAVENQRSKLLDLMLQRKLRWDGQRLLRGHSALVYQWPIGFRNPKPEQPWQ